MTGEVIRILNVNEAAAAATAAAERLPHLPRLLYFVEV